MASTYGVMADMDVQIIAAAISAAVAATIGVMTWANSRANLKERRISEKRRSLAKKLNEFYGPLISYLNITKSLRNILDSNKPPEFRTLTHLLDPEQEYDIGANQIKIELTESDRIIIGEIVEIERKIEDLIVEKGGLVEDKRLMFDYYEGAEFKTHYPTTISSTSLANLITHFRVLRLAFEGKIVGEVERYKGFVFPRETVKLIHENYEKLHRELEALSNDS